MRCQYLVSFFEILCYDCFVKGKVMLMNRLKELREKQGLTLDDIQLKTGIKRATFSRYENEKSEPKLATWKTLADFFKVDVGYLQGVINTPHAIDVNIDFPDDMTEDELDDNIKGYSYLEDAILFDKIESLVKNAYRWDESDFNGKETNTDIKVEAIHIIYDILGLIGSTAFKFETKKALIKRLNDTYIQVLIDYE